jgi:hypothetical protein
VKRVPPINFVCDRLRELEIVMLVQTIDSKCLRNWERGVTRACRVV